MALRFLYSTISSPYISDFLVHPDIKIVAGTLYNYYVIIKGYDLTYFAIEEKPFARPIIFNEHDLGSGLQHQFGGVGIREFREVILYNGCK